MMMAAKKKSLDIAAIFLFTMLETSVTLTCFIREVITREQSPIKLSH